MPLPNTYLLTPPPGLTEDPFGAAMRSVDLIAGLRKCNPRIVASDRTLVRWMEGQRYEWMVPLWLGPPREEGSKFLLSMHAGIVPEFSQLDKNGCVVKRGWRAVIEKLTAARIISKRAANRVFKIDLDYDGWDGYCIKCRKDGKLERGVSGVSKLCEDCEGTAQAIADGERRAQESKARRGWKRTKEYAI